jgi:hypothetical protein
MNYNRDICPTVPEFLNALANRDFALVESLFCNYSHTINGIIPNENEKKRKI